jgi:Domain of unknown function (DUF6473)/Sulfotransferase family
VRQFVFICGCARSGTSALVQLLDAHSEISIGMERYITRFLSGNGLSPELFEEERFFSVEEGDTFYDNLDFLKPLYDSLRSKWQRSVVVGDKIPKLYTRYDHVFERFPEARVIFVSRNLIDVANSYKRRAEDESDQDWSQSRGAAAAIDDWNTANSLTLAALDRFPGKIYVLSYESLFLDRSGLEELFAFIGLRPSRDVHERFKNQLQRSSTITAHRSESLSAAEKLAICLRADTESFRRLVERAVVLPSVAQPATSKSGGTAAKSANLRTDRQRSSISAGTAAPTTSKAGKYQDSDRPIIDYQYAYLPGTAANAQSLVRGPIPADLAGGFIACLGGAHTFGRFIEHPYPILLQRQLGIPILNLGHGGGKPEFYLQSKGFIDVINKAQCAVIQVMSARGSPNRFLKPRSYAHNMMTVAEGISIDKNPVFVDGAYRALLKQLEPEKMREAINETRAHWLAEMGNLLDRIVVPKLLFWFSVRTPAYVEGFNDVDALLGDYPQFVTDEMIEKLKPKVQAYIECVGKQGLPNALRDAKSGEPVAVFPWQPKPSFNYYYPSAEMHVAAAEVLAPALRGLVQVTTEI